MYHCEICGRKCSKKIRYGGYTLCPKHMHQLRKYGKFLDANPRTNHDLNGYKVDEEVTTVFVYNQKNDCVGQFLIDTEDLPKIKYHKWRFSHQHVVTGCGAGHIRECSHVILQIPKEKDDTIVDHINGDAFDNRKQNLRICSQQENLLNKSSMITDTSGFIGISFESQRNKYSAEIRKGYVRCHLGRFDTLKEAVYARYLAEGMVFQDFYIEQEHLRKFTFIRDLEENRKKQILCIVRKKLEKNQLLS